MVSAKAPVPFGREMRKQFLMDDNYVNLNHGSFGTFPAAIRNVARQYQDEQESRPDPFIRYAWPKRLDECRAAMAQYLNVPVETVVFVPNATTGVNTVLRSLVFQPGDKIAYFSTIYGACEKTVQYITETTPAEAVKIQYTYPVSDDELVAKLRDAIKQEKEAGNRIKVAIFDTIVSLPGVRMPFERLTDVCRENGVLSLIDGAHCVGQIPIDLGALQPDFFVSNCHKWLYVPRGCAVFYVPVANQPLIRSTLPTSHGFTALPRAGTTPVNNPLPPSSKSAYVTAFEFVGTIDSTNWLTVPAALEFRDSTCGGETAIMQYCIDLAREGGNLVARCLHRISDDVDIEKLGLVMENPEKTLRRCAFANVRLPLEVGGPSSGAKTQDAKDAKEEEEEEDLGVKNLTLKSTSGDGHRVRAENVPLVTNYIASRTVEDHDTFVAIIFYGGAWWARLSAQIYLDLDDFRFAAKVLDEICDRVKRGEYLDVQKA
ncbi:putative cysteine desulfurylase [Xylona heveae TC161]|uniref:Putative cysteine desulfurylase n=1 Tax=Xylona heveae (strain CBS 132557 / TC161) TaxID=1328760 RepID=A0A165HEI3_XYLHT|nr:putative cysteine desulfurylase [Xylona heveae TC161]KZF23390.1 putative cysteine desulfurylase [Xylona heveae TC161]